MLHFIPTGSSGLSASISNEKMTAIHFAFLVEILVLMSASISSSFGYGGNTDCCRFGNYVSETVSLTVKDPSAVCLKIARKLTLHCKYSYTTCCLQSLENKFCRHGVTVASNASQCSGINLQDPMANYISKQCCMCCYLSRTQTSSSWRPSGLCKRALELCESPNEVTTTKPQNTGSVNKENNERADYDEEEQQEFDNSTEIVFNATIMMPTTDLNADENVVSTTTPMPMICDSEFSWNEKKRVCEKIIISCPRLHFFNKTMNHCVRYSEKLQDCEKGYRRNRLTARCEDIDECQENKTICQGKEYICVNKPGTYVCLCQSGYTRHDKSDRCIDIDECLHNLHNCHTGQRCANKIGGFKCVRIIGCGFGYSLDDDTQNCLDINECESGINPCGSGMSCFNLPGSFLCKEETCGDGLVRNRKTGTCEKCYAGFRFDNETKRCEDINECADSNICEKNQVCENTRGSYQCRYRVVCALGTRLSRNGPYCEDINECVEKRHECEDPYVCINTEGSYHCRINPCNSRQTYDVSVQKCICKYGFRIQNGDCQDINECAEMETSLCGEQFVCVNNIGSYFCKPFSKCERGYRRINNFTDCEDIDECALGHHVCDDNSICTNLPGSYTCLCKRGFRKDSDGHCKDVNECETMSIARLCPGKHLKCENTIGSYVCNCRPGFRSIGWTKFCEDIDECYQNQTICGFHQCINLQGSYKCQCTVGFSASPDGKSCHDIDECTVQGGRLCRTSQCQNTFGSYFCKCPPGYQMGKNAVCVDRNECASRPRICLADHRCINLEGTFRCITPICPPGYKFGDLANGFKCLNTSSNCQPGDLPCLNQNPTVIDNLFIEVNIESGFPHRVYQLVEKKTPDNKGYFSYNINVIYAKNSNNGKLLNIPGAFRLKKRTSFYRTTVSLMIVQEIRAPADVLLEFRRNVYSSKIDYRQPYRPRRLHLYDTVAYINLYITKKLL